MKIDTKNIEQSRIQLTIEVPTEQVQEAREKAIKRIGEQVTVPGFRKGKAPQEMLQQYVGEKSIMDESVDIIIQNTYASAVQEKNIRVVARPEKVELKSFEPFVYEIIVAIYPQVTLKDYKKIKITKEPITVSETEINDIVRDMQKRFAEYTSVDRIAQVTDRVTIDFEGKDEQGVSLDGAKSKNHKLILGEKQFIPGFEEQLLGMKKGEEKTFEVVFPADYHAKHLQNKKVLFDTKIHEIEEVKFPELTEDLIEKIKKKKMTKEEFLTEIKKDVEHYKEHEQERKRESELMEKLLGVGELEIPEALIQEELEYMLSDMKHRVGEQGISYEQYLAYIKKTEEELKEQWKKDAQDRVAVRVILRAIIDEEKIIITDEEIEKEIATIIAHYPETEHQKIKEAYATGTHTREDLCNKLQVKKVITMFLQENL